MLEALRDEEYLRSGVESFAKMRGIHGSVKNKMYLQELLVGFMYRMSMG